MDTKEKLLHSAAILFSEKGFSHTSVAEICEKSCTNIASVNYHFRSKEQLYKKVLEYTYDQAEKLYPLPDLSRGTPEKNLYLFILSLLRRILSKEMTGNFYKILSREMAEPSIESGTFINKVISKNRDKVEKLIRDIHGENAGNEIVFMMTHSIISQCLFLGINEKGRQHHLNHKPVGPDDAESFARHIADFSIGGIKKYRSFDRAR